MTVPTNEHRYGEFAAKQLSKYGWKDGKGLGREGEGITRAISLAKKDDSKGLGSGSDTWGFAWWDHVYNKSSSAIKVEKGDSGVMLSTSSKGGVERNRMGIISTERPSKHNKEKKKEKKKKEKKEKKSKKAADTEDKSDVEDTAKVATKPAAVPIWMRGTFVASAGGGLTGTV
ncbi:hypothetical protein BDF22DRAFT_679434 [Syncephalis plumigaleata]|nr:hypothetical protein BDF22DRAFT_679434 [Syncephalis plumigaleata]